MKVGTDGTFDLVTLKCFGILRSQCFKALLAHLRRIVLFT
jgi:hypothetical protein